VYINHTYKVAAKLMHITHNIKYRIRNTEALVHKIINVPVFYMALGLNDFDEDKSITRAI
jgi:hypothetical protein